MKKATTAPGSSLIYRYFANRGGWRFVVLYHNGHKHVRLFDIGTFEIYKITPRYIERLKPDTVITPKKLVAHIKRRRRMFQRCDVGFPKKTVQKVLAVLSA